MAAACSLSAALRARFAAERKASGEHEAVHPLRMARRIGNRYGAALGDSEQIKPLEPGGIDDGFQVAHKGVQGYFVDVPIRQAHAPSVVAEQRMVTRQIAPKMTPNRAFQVFFQMRHPIAGPDQWWPLANARVGDLYAVRRAAEADLLFRHG